MKLWFVLSWAKRRVNDMQIWERGPLTNYYVSHHKLYSYIYEEILLIIQPCNDILLMHTCTLLPCPLYSYTLPTNTLLTLAVNT